jgi:magnesium chelatase subunit I
MSNIAIGTHLYKDIDDIASTQVDIPPFFRRRTSMVQPFPFSAIVGQDEMKEALMMAAVDPRLGGVLVFGDRGTGKSTAVRALAALLPRISVRKGCRFNCSAEGNPDCPDCAGRHSAMTEIAAPVVDLPLGATEDRVVGALDIERALVAGEKRFEPGLLARAHRGFLYIDEVNLLEDHLVDLLLDVAASGVNVVEREGLSVRHPARFVLIGSGNPEEGELRPQLLDRFGLMVEVSSPNTVGERVEVVRRREAYEADPEKFLAAWDKAEKKLRRRITKAQSLLSSVTASDDVLEFAANLCMRLGVDGLRGELTLVRAARALAALDGRVEASKADIVAVAPMALRHRLRRDPLDEAGSAARVERVLMDVGDDAPLNS